MLQQILTDLAVAEEKLKVAKWSMLATGQGCREFDRLLRRVYAAQGAALGMMIVDSERHARRLQHQNQSRRIPATLFEFRSKRNPTAAPAYGVGRSVTRYVAPPSVRITII